MRKLTQGHGFILVPATGPYVQQGRARALVLALHRGACRGELQLDAGEERRSPSPWFVVRVIESGANIGCVLLCVRVSA
jgi:hypothetical protein